MHTLCKDIQLSRTLMKYPNYSTRRNGPTWPTSVTSNICQNTLNFIISQNSNLQKVPSSSAVVQLHCLYSSLIIQEASQVVVGSAFREGNLRNYGIGSTNNIPKCDYLRNKLRSTWVVTAKQIGAQKSVDENRLRFVVTAKCSESKARIQIATR